MVRDRLQGMRADSAAAHSRFVCDKKRSLPLDSQHRGAVAEPRWKSPTHKEGSTLRSSCTAFHVCRLRRVLTGSARSAPGRSGKLSQPALTGKAVNSHSILSAEPQTTAPLTDFQINARIHHNSPGSHSARGSSALSAGNRKSALRLSIERTSAAASFRIGMDKSDMHIRGSHFFHPRAADRNTILVPRFVTRGQKSASTAGQSLKSNGVENLIQSVSESLPTL